MKVHPAVIPIVRRAAGASAVVAVLLAFAAFGAGSAAASADSPFTTTVLTVVPLFAGPGDPITLTARVTGTGGIPPGTVVFASDTAFGSAVLTPIAGSSTTSEATFTTSFGVGVYPLTATYVSGDLDNFFNSTSSPVLLNVTSAVLHNTTTTLTSNPLTVTAGQAVTLTAVIAESDGGTTIPTGDVTFNEGGVLLGTASLDATGTARLIVTDFLSGTHVVTASYLGDIIDRSSSATLGLTVTPGSSSAVQTTTTVTVTPGRIVAGQSVALAAHVIQTGTPTTPPAGPLVTFTANGVWVGEAPLDANGNATVTVTGWVAGTYDIKASYVGDINDRASSGNAPLGVLASTTPLTVTGPSVSITYGGTVPALTPTYSGFVSGDTLASLSSPATCTTAATTASPVGSYPVTCSGAAGSTYTISYVNGSVTIAPAVLTVTAVSASITAGQAVPALTATITGFVNGQTLAGSGVTGLASCTTTATASSAAGTYPITCALGTLAAANYSFGSFVAGTLTVSPASPPVICARPADDDHDSGEPHDRGRGSICESLLSHPTPGASASVRAGQMMSIVYMDETPIGTGALAPVAVLSKGQLLPVTVTLISRAASRYQSLLTFSLPSTLAPGKYAVLLTVHDSDGHLDQRIWQLKVGKSAGHDDGNDERDWQSLVAGLLARFGSINH